MIKKYTTLALICLLLITADLSVVSAQTVNNSTVKADVLKRGTGKNKRLEVKRLDGTKLKGYVSQAGEDSFTLVERESRQPVVIAYNEVAKVKNRSSGGDKIAFIVIGAAAATAAVIALSFLAIRCRNEGGC